MKSMNKVQTFGLKLMGKEGDEYTRRQARAKSGGIAVLVREDCCLISKLLQVTTVLT